MNQLLIKKLKQLYKKGNLVELATRLPHMKHLRDDSFIQFLFDSNLLRMRDWLTSPSITLGADPEFILCAGNDPDNIILFSSAFTGGYFGVSEAEMGADYGLLEFRPEPSEKAEDFVDSIVELHDTFIANYGPDPDEKGSEANPVILEKEAVKFDHKRKRVLQAMESGEEINYGMNRGKDVAVWGGGGDIMTDVETGMTLCAYDKPVFNQFNDKLFTAGGHIHVGGSLVKMLSPKQLVLFVRKLDKEVLPICNSVESEAGELRREVYGSLGEFRIKEYGIEYRSPSNAIFFKKNSKVLLKALKKVEKIISTMAIQ
jgi:hypothetical protein